MSELINSQVSADKDALVYFWKRKTCKNVRANKKNKMTRFVSCLYQSKSQFPLLYNFHWESFHTKQWSPVQNLSDLFVPDAKWINPHRSTKLLRHAWIPHLSIFINVLRVYVKSFSFLGQIKRMTVLNKTFNSSMFSIYGLHFLCLILTSSTILQFNSPITYQGNL